MRKGNIQSIFSSFVIKNLILLFFVIILPLIIGPAYSQIESILSVTIANSSYVEGDTVVISGKVTTIILDNPVVLQIFNPARNLIEIAQLDVAQDGSYTHTIIAQGPLWKSEGEYVVRATYGGGNIAEARFEFATETVDSDNIKIFEVDAGSSGTFDVEYKIRGGEIQDIIIDPQIFALIVIIESNGDGAITVDLPRTSIDAIKSDGTDDQFIILIDGQEVRYQESKDEIARAITIDFEQGDSDIEIIGTQVIPEFGAIAPLIFAMAIILPLVATKRMNQIFRI